MKTITYPTNTDSTENWI